MIKIPREQFFSTTLSGVIFEMIKRNHRVADHTQKVLEENKHIEGFCEVAEHYVEMGLGSFGTKHISYEVNSYYAPDRALISVRQITIYDSIVEYEAARSKLLYTAGAKADIPNMN